MSGSHLGHKDWPGGGYLLKSIGKTCLLAWLAERSDPGCN